MGISARMVLMALLQRSVKLLCNQWRSGLFPKKAADAAQKVYSSKVGDCDKENEDLNSKSAECNTYQYALEEAACSAANKYYDVMTNFHNTWKQLYTSYQGITDLVYQQTQDRKMEYKTLMVVSCLLRRVHELNGRPCDETTNTVESEIGKCEQEGIDLDPCTVEKKDDICPPFEGPPVTPPQPDPFPYPCTQEWKDEEMLVKSLGGNLPDLPQAPFHEDNPGCNQYPDCSPCANNPTVTTTLDFVVWLHPEKSFSGDNANSGAAHATFGDKATEYALKNSLRSATVEGCGTKMDVKYADDKAATRCCSDDASNPCVTPGEADQTCDLYKEATFHDANYVCSQMGLRLCTRDEIGTGSKCCGTGCGFDSQPVWISGSVESDHDF